MKKSNPNSGLLRGLTESLVDYELEFENKDGKKETLIIEMQKPKDLMETGQRLMNLREGLGITRTDFSKMLGIPYRTLTDWELGERKMPDYVYRLILYWVKMEQKGL